MSWLFNTDYESKLFSDKPLLKESSRINQEFEYLLFFLGIGPVATSKKYSDDFIAFGKTFPHFDFSISQDLASSQNFWGKMENVEKEKYLNSKITSATFAKEHNLAHPSTYVSSDVGNLASGFLIKAPHGFSGRQIFESGKEVKEQGPLVIEKKLDRVKDFSCYIQEQGDFFYQNTVDQKFQYKGSQFDRENMYDAEKFLNDIGCTESFKYLHGLELIKAEWGSDGYSIDSFLYKEDQKLKTYILGEINFRKTFGWLSKELGDKFFPSHRYFGNFLVNSKKFLPSFSEREKLKQENIFVLSPLENQFQVVIWGASSEKEREVICQKFLNFY